MLSPAIYHSKAVLSIVLQSNLSGKEKAFFVDSYHVSKFPIFLKKKKFNAVLYYIFSTSGHPQWEYLYSC